MTQRSPDPVPLAPPIPANEAERLAALHRYQILDTPPEAAFDRITSLAARLFNAPIALVSLLDESRAWFKSGYGFEPREVERNETICSFAVLSDDVLVALDTRQDPRFSCNPFVQRDPGVRCYIGAPLITHDGFNLGTLCLLDTQPREAFSLEQQTMLADLAAMVVDELELRLAAQRIAQTDTAMLEITQGVSGVTGEAFLNALVQHFAKVLGVDYTYIGLLVDRDQESLKTIATCAHGQIVENFEYLLRDTPCKEVIRQRKLCCYPQNVQVLFPHAPLLAPLQIESYIAVPFYDSSGAPLGLLGVMDSKPLENIQLAEFLLPVFALRIAAELERQRASQQQAQLLAREQEARQQAEAANRIKDEFLAVLSHELRTPLNPILGWSRMLRIGNLDAARTAHALETIERNAKLQTQLIEDLLDVSRILRGKLSLEQSPVDLSVVISSALETVHLAAETKAIDLRFTILDFGLAADHPKLQVLGDAGRLQQVVWNLLTNAVKFTPDGGRVEVRLEQIEGGDRGDEENRGELLLSPSSSSSPPSYAKITVTDTGKGINPDFLPHVFEYFRQADSATTRKFGGLGLGLAIVHHLVELHGGTVQADSPGEGQGATFTVRLPLLGNGELGVGIRDKVASPLPTPHSPLTGLNILLVDDEPDTREFQAFVLEQSGAKVTAVASGLEALQSLDQFIPDVLVSDVGMAEIDGYMLIQQIRSRPDRQGRTIPAIALTAYAAEIDQKKALQAGFQAHLTKPVEPEVLVQAIVNLLQESRASL